jgi:hypothetical protein
MPLHVGLHRAIQIFPSMGTGCQKKVGHPLCCFVSRFGCSGQL